MLDRLRTAIAARLRNAIRERLTIRGFTVIIENTRPDIATSDVVERLDEALALIESYQPWRFAHLRRDFAQIWIVRYPCRGAYYPVERACVAELTFLARRDIGAATVAACIIHEGMHARIFQIGVSPETRDLPREERLCRRAELEFGRALPPELGRPIIERTMEMLRLDDDAIAPAIDWQEANLRVAEIDRAARASRQRA